MGQKRPMRRRRLALLAFSGAVLAWRIAVLVDLERSPLLSEDSTGADVTLVAARSVMGLLFLACGWVVMAKRRHEPAGLFALYAFCAALHWGGPLYAASDTAQLAIWLGYFTVSAMLAQAAFLHFTLVYPEAWSWGPHHLTRAVIYFPVVLGALGAFLAVAAMPEPASEGWQDKFFILESLQVNLFALAGLVVLVVRFVRDRPEDGPREITGPLAFGGWLAVLPWAVAAAIESQGGSVPGGAGAYTLFFALMPLVGTWALLRYQPAVEVDIE